MTPVIDIPDSLGSFDVFTLIWFNNEYADADKVIPVITIFGTTPETLAPPKATVKVNGADADGVPIKLPVKAVGDPENSPVGNVIVMVSLVTNAVETFNEMVREPAPLVAAQAAVPETRPTEGIHFFALLSQIVPTSQHEGP